MYVHHLHFTKTIEYYYAFKNEIMDVQSVSSILTLMVIPNNLSQIEKRPSRTRGRGKYWATSEESIL